MTEKGSPEESNEELEQSEDYKTSKFLAFYKKQQNIFQNSEDKEKDAAAQYQSILLKDYVDLRSDIESSVAIHILLKTEKNKLEQTFLKNAIEGLQLFQKHRNLLSQGFGNHLFSQMKVEYHQKFHPVFHYGDYGQKYFIVLKGSVDLLMPKSDCVEENSRLQENGESQIAYFQRGNFEGLPHEQFDQFLLRQYPNMSFIKTFQPGEAFGEIALITGQKRTGSIIVREDVCFLVITKQAFHEIVGKFHEFLQIQKLNYLSQFFFLQHIPKAKLLSLIQFMKILQFKRNNVLYDERQPTNGIYFLREGEVSITTKISAPPSLSQSQQSGKIQLLRVGSKQKNITTKTIIKATNSYFGEEELVLELPQRKSRAVCMSETCEIFLFTKDIILTQARQFNVLNKLKQNYKLKANWEEERTASIQNVVKSQEERVKELKNTPQKNIVSLSMSQIDPSVLIDYQPQTQRNQVNTEERIPTQTSIGFVKQQSRQHGSQDLSINDHGSSQNQIGLPNQALGSSGIAQQKSASHHVIPQGKRFSNILPDDGHNSVQLKEDSEGAFLQRHKSENFKIKPKSMDHMHEVACTLRGNSSNTQNKEIDNVSIDKVFYDSTHSYFESMLRQEESAKSEIFAKINSKSKSIQPKSIFTDTHKAQFRIRNNSLQQTPIRGPHKLSLQLSSHENSQSFLTSDAKSNKLRRANTNVQELESPSPVEINPSTVKTDHNISSSKQIDQDNYHQSSIHLPQLRQSTSQPPLFKENQQNSQLQDTPLSNKNNDNNINHHTNTNNSPLQSPPKHLLPLQFPSSHLISLTSFPQLDTLFEEDDETNSPNKRRQPQNGTNVFSKIQLLEKFSLGKKVASYIRRKSENENYFYSNTHYNQWSGQISEQLIANNQADVASNQKIVDYGCQLKYKGSPQKQFIKKTIQENNNIPQEHCSITASHFSFIHPTSKGFKDKV